MKRIILFVTSVAVCCSIIPFYFAFRYFSHYFFKLLDCTVPITDPSFLFYIDGPNKDCGLVLFLLFSSTGISVEKPKKIESFF
jgi:hypothetical protein